ncbi:putative regulator of V-ATPase in vacuolar membrane protein [Cercophora samala]|uniref:Regulator of V-ATPase in vacuolar membrane protein n=1 Tax=Cercophora samala TaxID=330535 RepID=A0AA39ZND9_9PEZI|nr:putative regulator of V-ATPase in vacuolar membrane protein [Cercophora samala]
MAQRVAISQLRFPLTKRRQLAHCLTFTRALDERDENTNEYETCLPSPRLQALATGYCQKASESGRRRITVYISGAALSILSDHHHLLQTIYDDDPTPLQSVSLDETTAKIAVVTDSGVGRIYKPTINTLLPLGSPDREPRWVLQGTFSTSFSTSLTPHPTTLSWGSDGELLVSSDKLQLWQTSRPEGDIHLSWSKLLPNPARVGLLSYDSAYIASVGYHDRLVKVWRRLSYGSGGVGGGEEGEEVVDGARFDFMYLRHEDVVTRLEWRKGPRFEGQTVENVLWTVDRGGRVRVWVGGDGYGHRELRLWGGLEMGMGRGRGVGWVVQGGDLMAAAETAVERGGEGLEKVVEVANRSPEVVVGLDGKGGVKVWGLENVGWEQGQKDRRGVWEIVEVKGVEGLDWGGGRGDHVEVQSYCDGKGLLHVLVHFFDGRIEVYKCDIAALFDPNPKRKRLERVAVWTGHSAPVKKVVRNFSGRAIVTRTESGQSIIWKHELDPGKGSTTLKRQVIIQQEGHIHRMCVLRKGRFVVFLRHERVELWDCRGTEARLLAGQSYDVAGKPLCLIVLPRHKVEDYTTAHVATITSEKEGVVWEVKFPFYRPNDPTVKVVNGGGSDKTDQEGYIREFVKFKLDDAGDLAYVLPVDPAGSDLHVSGFLDVFARDVAISYTHSGRVEFWTARVGHEGKGVEWLSTSSLETGVANPALVSGSTIKKAALVDAERSTLTIWDIRGARLEYEQKFENSHTIRDLDWAITPAKQSILAVGFPHRVLLLSQMRFDYLNEGPAWAPTREISIRSCTPHPIGDSVWLGDGHLVIAAGNQLFVHDREFEASKSLVPATGLRIPHRKGKGRQLDLFEVVDRLNGPLPVFHPQFLSMCILAGKISLVHKVLQALHKTLRFWAEGDVVDDYLGLDLVEFYAGDGTLHNGGGHPREYLNRRQSFDEGEEPFSEETAVDINERLTRIGIPQLSGHEQIQLVDIVECVGMVEKQRRSLDENGARFMLAFRQHALRKGRANAIHISWREINWAYHSTSQDVLVDFVTKQNHGRMLWEGARESGMFMWLGDNAAVKQQFEMIARNEYTKGEDKNPIDCSLYYLALKKKTVLQGLWRMASWNREQASTSKFLANNFDDPKWRTAALKNAYALMSKRRFEYAAAFFLLADHLHDAVNVCLNQLCDLQLAVAIARVYEGDGGPVLKRLLEEEVLSTAAREGNRWLASWAFWMLGRRDMAVRALITPVFALLETPGSPDLKSKSYLTDDPALIILYRQLRQKTLQTLRGATKVTPKVEWEFVLHSAGLYDRMGCDLLGLDLVRNWEFFRPAAQAMTGLGGEINPLRLLKRRGSLVVADIPMLGGPLSPLATPRSQGQGQVGGGVPGEMKTGGVGGGGVAGGMGTVKGKPPPTVFEEPDANSLLDSFGF